MNHREVMSLVKHITNCASEATDRVYSSADYNPSVGMRITVLKTHLYEAISIAEELDNDNA